MKKKFNLWSIFIIKIKKSKIKGQKPVYIFGLNDWVGKINFQYIKYECVFKIIVVCFGGWSGEDNEDH